MAIHNRNTGFNTLIFEAFNRLGKHATIIDLMRETGLTERQVRSTIAIWLVTRRVEVVNPESRNRRDINGNIVSLCYKLLYVDKPDPSRARGGIRSRAGRVPRDVYIDTSPSFDFKSLLKHYRMGGALGRSGL